jgi:hypothetical protein
MVMAINEEEGCGRRRGCRRVSEEVASVLGGDYPVERAPLSAPVANPLSSRYQVNSVS